MPALLLPQSLEHARQLTTCTSSAEAHCRAVPRPRRPVAPCRAGLLEQSRPGPTAVPIEHSPTFLRRQLRPEVLSEEELEADADAEAEHFTGNAMEWVLRRADQSLDEAEQNPNPNVKAFWDATRSPTGVAMGKTATAVAALTVKAGISAAKAAAPVGKWALQEGARAAFAALASSKTARAQGAKRLPTKQAASASEAAPAEKPAQEGAAAGSTRA